METKKIITPITTIPTDKVITLEIGGAYYARINKLLIEYSSNVSNEKLLVALRKINRKKENLHEDPFAFNLETIMILLHDVEFAFKEAGFTDEEEVEVEVPIDFEFDDKADDAEQKETDEDEH